MKKSVLLLCLIILCHTSANAYIDAGTSGLIFQLGYVLFTLFFAFFLGIPKRIMEFLKNLVGIKGKKSDKSK